MELHRGDIVLVNFNPTIGVEMGKLRPAIIVITKEDNDILDTVIEPDTMPYRFHIISRDKLEKNSDVCIYEIRALSKNRIKEKLSKLSTDEIKTVQKRLCEIVG